MNTLESWIEAACAELGIVEVARPAAPVTAYLLGVAVGRGEPTVGAADRLRRLAVGWAATAAAGGPADAGTSAEAETAAGA